MVLKHLSCKTHKLTHEINQYISLFPVKVTMKCTKLPHEGGASRQLIDTTGMSLEGGTEDGVLLVAAEHQGIHVRQGAFAEDSWQKTSFQCSKWIMMFWFNQCNKMDTSVQENTMMSIMFQETHTNKNHVTSLKPRQTPQKPAPTMEHPSEMRWYTFCYGSKGRKLLRTAVFVHVSFHH